MITVSYLPYLQQRHIYKAYKALCIHHKKPFLTFRGWLDLPF